MITKNEEAFISEIYQRFLNDLQQVEEINHLPIEIWDMFSNEWGMLLMEGALGIGPDAFKRICPIIDKIIKNHKSYSRDILEKGTALGLIFNGENYTAWNIRQEIFDETKIDYEIKLTELIGLKFPNASVAYTFRLKLVQMRSLNLEDENRFLLKGINKKNRNYNLWTYRINLMKLMKKNDWFIELDFMKGMFSKQLHNHSYYHYLIVILRLLMDKNLFQSFYLFSKDQIQYYETIYFGQLDTNEEQHLQMRSLKGFIQKLEKQILEF